MNRSTLSIAVLVVLLAGCQQETRPLGPPEVKVDVPDTTLIALSKIVREDADAGWLKTYRYGETGGPVIRRVTDVRHQALGYITSDGRAFRYRAHDEPELVANSTDIRRNVAAVLGSPMARVELKEEASIER